MLLRQAQALRTVGRVTDRASTRARLRQSFDRAAKNFDAVALLPREIAARMAERLSLVRLPVRCILDVGCGTGHGARLLKQRYRDAFIVELDLSEQMLRRPAPRSISGWLRTRRRQRPFRVCADFQQLPIASAAVDLVWSNLAWQWAADPDAAVAEAHRVLRPGGLLMFSTFGPDTLEQLRVASNDELFRINRHIDMHDIGDALVRCGFADPVMDMENITLTYADVPALLRDLRAHGSIVLCGAHGKAGLHGRSGFTRVMSRYEQFRRDDGRLPASLEVIYGHAWKPQPRMSPKGKPVIDIRST